MNKLFRSEAIESRTRRLAGNVFLAVPLSASLLGWLLTGVVIAAAVFVSLASYARKETVVGWIVPDRGLIRAVALQGGRIDAIAVREGDNVRQGDALATIKVSSDIGNGDAGTVFLQGLSAEANATRAGLQANTARLDLEARQLREHLHNLQSAQREVGTQIDLQQERVRISQNDVDRAQVLAAQGFFPRRDLEVRQGAVFAEQQNLASLRQQKLSLEGDIIDATSRLQTIPVEATSAGATSAVNEAQIDERRADAQSHSSYVVLASMNGSIAALPVRIGQTIPPGTAVAAIVPEGSHLEAELYVPSRAAGFIRRGQEVRLLYEAFPHQRFGAGAGVVTEVSRTVLAPSEVAIPGITLNEPVFRVEVRLSRDYVQAYGQPTRLQPGMLLTADLIVDRRSLLEWLLDPIYAVGRR